MYLGDLLLSLANLDQDPKMLSATSCHGSKTMTQTRQIVRRHHCEAKKKNNASRDLGKATHLETKLTFHIKSANTVLSRSKMRSLRNEALITLSGI